MPFIIGADIGTTHTKAIAFSTDGEVLAEAQASYPVFSDQQGWHELDPAQLLGALVSAIREALEKTAHQEGLSGICLSCAMHSLIAVDAAGKAMTRAMTWADLRSQSYATELRNSEAGLAIYQQTGTPIHAMSPLCKLLWLKDNRPEIFAGAAKFVSIKEYIWKNLFGEYVVDHSIASATGLFDIYALDWYAPSLSLAGISPDRLSKPVPSTHQASELSTGYARQLGLDRKVPFIIGGSDGCLANLGSGAISPGATALTIGTSGAVRMTTSKPQRDAKQRLFSYVLGDGLYVCGGATNNGGSALQWYARQFLGRSSVDSKDLGVFVEEAANIPPGSEGLVFLPYLQGERAPLWNADARGVFFGIRSFHTQAHFMRAVIEGVSFSLLQVGRSLEETIGAISCIYASGGFIRSRTWLQIMADIFDRKVFVTQEADASAIGASLMGMYALGLIKSPAGTQQMIRVTETYLPDGDKHRHYQRSFDLFTTLYDRLKDLMQ